jgi:Ca2+-binding RTX toxin-like protein
MPIILRGTPASEEIYATPAFSDYEIHGLEGNDRLVGSIGHDTLFGGKGSDELEGDDGNDKLWGGDGPTESYYDADYGADNLHGGRGIDELHGQNGNDKLFGGDHQDLLDGGRGDDLLDGGRGRDMLRGDEGADTFWFSRNSVGPNGDIQSDSSLDPQTMDHVQDFFSGIDVLQFQDGPAGPSSYKEHFMPEAVLTAATAEISTGVAYVFIADGHNGFMFADTNADGVVDLGVILDGLYKTTMFAPADIIMG